MIIKYFLEPLQKLKIVLILALDQFFDFDVFHNTELGKVLLEYLKIVNVLIIIFGLEIDFTELNFPWIKELEHLTVVCASAKLLYFGDIGVKKVIEPVEEFATGEFDGIAWVKGNFVDHWKRFEFLLYVKNCNAIYVFKIKSSTV